MLRYLFWTVAAAVSLAALVAVALAPDWMDGGAPVPDEGTGGTPPGTAGHPDPYPAPDFALVDQHGDERSLADFRGQWVTLFFGFTHCPDVCPTTLANLTGALEALGDDAERISGVLVTVDPERDTPERLREYLDAFHPSLVGLTGEPGEIEEVAAAYGIHAERAREDDGLPGGAEGLGTAESPPGHESGEDGAGPDVPGAGEGYGLQHSSLLLVVDPQGRIVTSFPPYTPREDLERGLRYLLEEH